MIHALHGAVGEASDWNAIASLLAGCGLTTRKVDLWRFLDCCPINLPDLGNALNAEIQAQDDAPILLAYSMGARIALHALLAQPEQYRAAILLAPHPGLSADLERSSRLRNDAEWSALAHSGDWTAFLNAWNAQPVLQSANEVLPDRRHLKQRRSAIARSFLCWSLGAQEDLRPLLSKISCPVLWLTGSKDEKFTRLAQECVSLMPQARHRILPDQGHRLLWECPAAIAHETTHFLQSL